MTKKCDWGHSLSESSATALFKSHTPPQYDIKIVSPKEFRRLNPETVHAKNHVRFDAKAAGVDCSRSVHRLPALPATRSCCIPPATLAAR